MWVLQSLFLSFLLFFLFPLAGLVPLYAPQGSSGEERLLQGAKISSEFQGNLSDEDEDRNFYEPRRLRVRKINLAAQIFPVGIDPSGYLALPDDIKSVGWFYKSAQVGEPGNLVLTGHFDLPGGKTGVFSRLRELSVGDTVIVDSTVAYEYIVTSVDWVYENDARRLAKVFAKSDTPVVTLVTCGGQWQSVKGTYDRRLLVRGVIKE